MMTSNIETQFSSNKNNNCSFSEPGLFTQLQQNNTNKSTSFIQNILSFYSSFKSNNQNKCNSVLSIDDAIQLLVKTIKIHFQLLLTANDIEYDTIMKEYLSDLNNQLIANSNNVSTYNKNYCIKLTNEDIIQKINQKIKEKISTRDSITNSPNTLRNSYEFVTKDLFNNFKKRSQSQINSPIVSLSKIKMNKISNTIRKSKEGSMTSLNDLCSDLTLSHRNYNYQKRKSINSEVNNNMNQQLQRNGSCCSCSNRNFTVLYNGIKPSPYTSFLVQKGRKIINDYNKIERSKEKERKKKYY